MEVPSPFVGVASLFAAFVVYRLVVFLKVMSSVSKAPTVFTFGPPFHQLAQFLLPPLLEVTMKSRWFARFKPYQQKRSTGFFFVSPLASAPTLMLADVAAIKEVASDPQTFDKPWSIYRALAVWDINLVASNYHDHRRMRRVVAPTFSARNDVLVWEQAHRIIDEWFDVMDGQADERGVVRDDDIQQKTMDLAFNIVSSAGFGVPLPWIMPPAKDDKPSFGESIMQMGHYWMLQALAPKWAYMLPIKGLERSKFYHTSFENYMYETIATRRKLLAEGNDSRDLFSALIKASAEGETKLSETELLSNVHMLLLAGHEMTGHTLAGTFLLLALYPEHQEILHKEAQEILGDVEHPPYTLFSQLPYALATFYETLRLAPSLMNAPKYATKDTYVTVHSIPDNPSETPTPTRLFVPKGTKVQQDIIATHYSPIYWDEPEEFRPSRFIDTPEKKWNRGAFLGFSAGARGCIGKTFANAEAVAIISKVMLKYKVSFVPECEEANKRRVGETVGEHIQRVYNAEVLIALCPKTYGIMLEKRV